MGRNAFTYELGYRGTVEERLDSKTIKGDEDACWLWTGSKDTSGYGCIRINGKLRHATQVVYELHHKVIIPKGMVVMHSCDNPPCVNPQHLELGTNIHNSTDKIRKGRGRWVSGSGHPQAKLSPEAVEEIRSLASSASFTFTDLATRYGVNRTTVARIVKCQNWRH